MHETAQFQVTCKGRDAKGKEVFNDAVSVRVNVRADGLGLSTRVDCPYKTGAKGSRCKASHPEDDTNQERVYCRFTIDLPYAIDHMHEIWVRGTTPSYSGKQ
ncbi:hypothetical protein ACFL2D_02995 [Patescibacteria group bacterium]